MSIVDEILEKYKTVNVTDDSGLKAKSASFVYDKKSRIATLSAEFDLEELAKAGKATKSGAERYANLTIKIPDMPLRFTGNCFLKVN